eukprot:CAMPEP_0114558124 /NCGR_PEP_ID=MMETSP0114-20121206/10203_1 /TAXON_ID=31324 /ORGANISM="Goniomonas sp, Strain m" /LENGTH=847 /DNA_ID=CAMNT_0001743471 /DNA_START=21 /DNA_END=2564 /DNA_ORIENTATION=-
MSRLRWALLVVLTTASTAELDEPSMNGPYPPWPPGNPGAPLPSFKPVHRGRSFTVYGDPITTRYSEVFWTAQPPVALPADFVAEYKGKVVSFTGFEVDIIRKLPNGTDVSVPSFEHYNHHYCATIRGAEAKMTYVGARTHLDGVQRRAIEVHPPMWEPRSLPTDQNPNSTVPTAQNFWQGNGNEHRKSFKFLPKGFGQMVHSPEEFILQPMLINTKNPDGSGTRGGPLPKSSMAPPGANYSGLMECPCTTRTEKVITGYTTRASGSCDAHHRVTTAEECFDAAAALVSPLVANVTVSSPTSPPGCFLMAHGDGNSYEVHFNTDTQSTAECGAAAGTSVRSMGWDQSVVFVALDLDEGTGNATITIKGPADVWLGVGFGATAMADLPYTIIVDGGTGAVSERKLGNHDPGTPLPSTVTVVSNTVGPQPSALTAVMRNHWGAAGRKSNASNYQDCAAHCDSDCDCVAWTFDPERFSTPYNLADAVCYLRTSNMDASGKHRGFTDEGWHDGMWSGAKVLGSQLRTVVLQRALAGASPQYFTFDARATGVPFIAAAGTTPTLSYHGQSRGSGAVMLVEAGAPVCLCRGNETGGTINGLTWANNCMPYPATTIARDKNPSCDITTYGGGMICCHHGIHLLDKDQEVPAPTDTVQMKFRFYYEDPDPAATRSAFFMFREVEVAHGEYDVPQCAEGTPASECVHTIVGHFQLKDAMHECHDRSDVWCAPSRPAYPQSDKVQLLHISPHCHGPACISMELINADTNETICKGLPVFGEDSDPMNEAGYLIGIPPCIWGSAEEGLLPPPVLSMETNLTAIKKCNSTYYHYGVMAHWQMRGAWADGPPDLSETIMAA